MSIIYHSHVTRPPGADDVKMIRNSLAIGGAALSHTSRYRGFDVSKLQLRDEGLTKTAVCKPPILEAVSAITRQSVLFAFGRTGRRGHAGLPLAHDFPRGLVI